MRGRIARIGIVLGIVLGVTTLRPAVAGGGGCHSAETTSARTTTIVMSGACFTPTLARVPVGSTVTWINKDPMLHTVTGVNGAWGSLEELTTDESLKARFDRAGVYPYYCVFHPAMAAAVLVGDANGPGAADGTSGSKVKDLVDTPSGDTTSVSVGTTKAATGSSPWLALPLALVTGGVGFGIGRRLHNHSLES